MIWKASMARAISNTSPLLSLYRIGIVDWLPNLFDEVWIPTAVWEELQEGQRKGYDVPKPGDYAWLSVVEMKAMPSEWLSLDLGLGELSAIALTLENPTHVILLDDLLARRTAQAAGLTVWSTLKVLLEGKAQGLTDKIGSYVSRLDNAGKWLSDDIRQRILAMAGES